MRKIILVSILSLCAISLFASYTLERYTFSTAGGHQSGTYYTSTSSFGQKIQGEISNSGYEGFLGILIPTLDQRPPLITSIDDVPNDQGLRVQLVWNKCAYDDVYAIDTYYSIWRLDEDFEGMGDNTANLRRVNSPLERGGFPISNREDGVCNLRNGSNEENTFTEPWKVVEKFRENPNKIYFWQRDDEVWTFIDTIPALQYDEYSLIAPTLADSSAVDINYSTFKVVYHDIYEFYESVPDSGYSVDNIPPDETCAYITQNGNNMIISWDEVTTGTFQGNSYEELGGVWYKIYAGDTPDFVCDETTCLETVTDLNYDHLLTGEDKKFFKIVVSDEPPVD